MRTGLMAAALCLAVAATGCNRSTETVAPTVDVHRVMDAFVATLDEPAPSDLGPTSPPRAVVLPSRPPVAETPVESAPPEPASAEPASTPPVEPSEPEVKPEVKPAPKGKPAPTDSPEPQPAEKPTDQPEAKPEEKPAPEKSEGAAIRSSSSSFVFAEDPAPAEPAKEDSQPEPTNAPAEPAPTESQPSEPVPTEPAPIEPEPATAPAPDEAPREARNGITVLADTDEHPQVIDAFCKQFADRLNAAKLIEENIGAHLLADGTVEGFVDSDDNDRKSGWRDVTLFTIRIDEEARQLTAANAAGDVHVEALGSGSGQGFRPHVLGAMLGRHLAYARLGLKQSAPAAEKP